MRTFSVNDYMHVMIGKGKPPELSHFITENRRMGNIRVRKSLTLKTLVSAAD